MQTAAVASPPTTKILLPNYCLVWEKVERGGAHGGEDSEVVKSAHAIMEAEPKIHITCVPWGVLLPHSFALANVCVTGWLAGLLWHSIAKSKTNMCVCSYTSSFFLSFVLYSSFVLFSTPLFCYHYMTCVVMSSYHDVEKEREWAIAKQTRCQTSNIKRRKKSAWMIMNWNNSLVRLQMNIFQADFTHVKCWTQNNF